MEVLNVTAQALFDCAARFCHASACTGYPATTIPGCSAASFTNCHDRRAPACCDAAKQKSISRSHRTGCSSGGICEPKPEQRSDEYALSAGRICAFADVAIRTMPLLWMEHKIADQQTVVHFD